MDMMERANYLLSFYIPFGNLCIITDSQNSRFGNSYPEAKLEQWEREGIFHRQSFKITDDGKDNF